MNPGRFFREALESHEFRSSDSFLDLGGVVFRYFAHVSELIAHTSDNANLLDIAESCKAGRFIHHIVDESAAAG